MPRRRHDDNAGRATIDIPLRLAALDEALVVTATQVDQPLSSVPDSTTIISGGDLRSRQQFSLGHALRSVPGLAVSWGFRPDEQDSLSRRWWPQGITTSADAGVRADETVAGRHVVLTSAYSKVVGGYGKGARITVHDVTDPARVRYRHVLLVEPHLGRDGGVELRPVHVHAGGIVWRREHLHVAGTARGIVSCRLGDA